METKPLTFQVALRAADGIVIASDTKIVTYDGIRSSSHASKIEVYPEYGLVCAWSGKDVAKTAVNILRERVTATKLRLDTIEIEVEQICREAWERHFGEEHTPYSRVQAKAKLILACRDALRLWQFDVRPDSTHLAVDDKVIAGDLGNAAVFFLERYYPKTPTPVQRLTFLAAHTTLLAGRLNPEYVDGLEVALCSEREIRKLSQTKIGELRRRSRFYDELFEGSIFFKA